MSILAMIALIAAIVLLAGSILAFVSVRKAMRENLCCGDSSVTLFSRLYLLLLVFFLLAYTVFTVNWMRSPQHEVLQYMLVSLLFFGSVFVGISTAFMRKFVDNVLNIKRNRIDTMTGLMTKSGIEIVGTELLNNSSETHALVVLDLDNFKQINDNHGHVVGDEIIKKLADLLRDAVRVGDWVGRFGGDEFLVILKSVDANRGTEIMQRVLREVVTALKDSQPDIPIGVSAGLTELVGGSREPYQQVLARADSALYQAKEQGGNRVVGL